MMSEFLAGSRGQSYFARRCWRSVARKSAVLIGVAGLLVCGGLQTGAGAPDRTIPHPLPSHPGNVFLAEEEVTVPVPAGDEATWRVVDYDGHLVAEGPVKDGGAQLGHLGIGYYEIIRIAGRSLHRVSIGVLERLHAPTPATSPIDIDGAMSWWLAPTQWASAANLCALAGLNRVRDRLDWVELEPRKGQFVESNRYDASVRAEAGAGLQVLQVGHHTPDWAGPNEKRFPLDLRDTYNFHREMARRWRGQVAAFEPWNEADHPVFGAHTGSEMASFQKAACLGLKAGNPEVIACVNVFAKHRLTTLGDFDDNQAWPYFDTFNLHHYEAFEAYSWLYADFRTVSAGKPLWVTECSVPVACSRETDLQEPSDEDLKVQSERVAMIYARSIYEGAQAVFYFLLAHFVENGSQFGLLHHDLTPRPAFVALAALGRLLPDAKAHGRLAAADGSIEGFVFDAKPDGKREKVLVLWSEREPSFALPEPPKACFDHLGRPRSVTGNILRLSYAPMFVVLADGAALPLIPPPEPAKLLAGQASPLVLQAVFPEASIILERSAYRIPASRAVTIPVFLYNFGEHKASGRLRTELSERWAAEFPTETEIAPGERKQLPLRLTCLSPTDFREAEVRIKGDFGAAGQPVLALRVVPSGQ